jgi:hypothetical protein
MLGLQIIHRENNQGRIGDDGNTRNNLQNSYPERKHENNWFKREISYQVPIDSHPLGNGL